MATFHDSALGSASASSVGPLATTDALAVTAGDLVVASAKWETGTTTITFDSGASTPLFTVANAVRQEASGLSICGAVYFWIATATGTINPRFTLGVARDFREIRAVSITPAAGKTFILGNVNAADGPSLATAISAGTASATASGVGVTAIALNGSRTITPGTNWLEPAEFNTSISAHEQYQLISGSGTITGDCTLSSAVEFVIQLALFTEVSTGGSRPPLSSITLNPGGILTGPSSLALGKAPNYGAMRWQEWEKYPWSAAAAAAIDIASAGVLSITGAAALTSVGTVAAAGAVTITGAAVLTATGTVASAGTLVITGAAAATSTGTLASAGTVVINGAAAPTAQGTIASAGTLVINGAAALTGLGSLAAAGTAVITGASDLTAPSVNDISSAGSIVITSSAALSAIGSLAASGALVITGAARLDDGAIVITTQPAGRSRQRGVRNIYRVTVDGHKFEFKSYFDAVGFLDKTKAAAETLAREAVRKALDAEDVQTPRFERPKITISSRDLRGAVSETRKAIEAIYESAAQDVEIAILIEIGRRKAEDEAIWLLW